MEKVKETLANGEREEALNIGGKLKTTGVVLAYHVCLKKTNGKVLNSIVVRILSCSVHDRQGNLY